MKILGQGLFLIVAFGFFLFGLFSFLSTGWLVVRSVQTQGKVVEYDTEYRTSKGKTSSATFLVVAFESKIGQAIKFKSNTTTNNTKHQIGSEVKVLYVPDNPNQARIDEFGDVWLVPLYSLVFGSIFGAIGLYCLRKIKNSDRHYR